MALTSGKAQWEKETGLFSDTLNLLRGKNVEDSFLGTMPRHFYSLRFAGPQASAADGAATRARGFMG